MLHRYSDVFRNLLGLVDLSLVGLAWLTAYALRFTPAFPPHSGFRRSRPTPIPWR